VGPAGGRGREGGGGGVGESGGGTEAARDLPERMRDPSKTSEPGGGGGVGSVDGSFAGSKKKTPTELCCADISETSKSLRCDATKDAIPREASQARFKASVRGRGTSCRQMKERSLLSHHNTVSDSPHTTEQW